MVKPVIPLTGNSADVTDKIEDVFEQIADAMLNDKKEISITLKTRRRVPTDKQSDEDLTRTLSFPGKTENEAWRFGECMVKFEMLMFILTRLQRS